MHKNKKNAEFKKIEKRLKKALKFMEEAESYEVEYENDDVPVDNYMNSENDDVPVKIILNLFAAIDAGEPQVDIEFVCKQIMKNIYRPELFDLKLRIISDVFRK